MKDPKSTLPSYEPPPSGLSIKTRTIIFSCFGNIYFRGTGTGTWTGTGTGTGTRNAYAWTWT